MRLSIFCIVLFAAVAAFAQNGYFIGNKFIPGDTIWYKTHSISTSHLDMTNSAPSNTKMEQTVFHHQYAIKNDKNGMQLVTVFDAFTLSYTTDSAGISYDSNVPGDSAQLYNMMVFPMHALLHHPLTIFINAQGRVDSIHGLEQAIMDASRLLARGEEVQKLRAILSVHMIAGLIEAALADLPNQYMSFTKPIRLERSRMDGKTQFIDDFFTSLRDVQGDTATLNRSILTRIASPTVTYNGQMCIVDSSTGYGLETIVFDLHRGAVMDAHETFTSTFRAIVPHSQTSSSVTRTDTLKADVTAIKYSSYHRKKARSHKESKTKRKK